MNMKKWMVCSLAALMVLGSLYGCGAKDQASEEKMYEAAYDADYGDYYISNETAAPLAMNASGKQAAARADASLMGYTNIL